MANIAYFVLRIHGVLRNTQYSVQAQNVRRYLRHKRKKFWGTLIRKGFDFLA